MKTVTVHVPPIGAWWTSMAFIWWACDEISRRTPCRAVNLVDAKGRLMGGCLYEER